MTWPGSFGRGDFCRSTAPGESACDWSQAHEVPPVPVQDRICTKRTNAECIIANLRHSRILLVVQHASRLLWKTTSGVEQKLRNCWTGSRAALAEPGRD